MFQSGNYMQGILNSIDALKTSQDDNSKSGLSTAAIVGIVIGSVFVVGCLGFCCRYFCCHCGGTHSNGGGHFGVWYVDVGTYGVGGDGGCSGGDNGGCGGGY